jgi:hypothetical protein
VPSQNINCRTPWFGVSFAILKNFQYRPSIARLQQEYSSRIARRFNRNRRRGAAVGKPAMLGDNSTSWVENADSVADFWEIARLSTQATELWQSRFKNS